MTLTSRQKEILIASARYGERQAATELGISIRTIKNTLVIVYLKLEVKSMSSAILLLAETNQL